MVRVSEMGVPVMLVLPAGGELEVSVCGHQEQQQGWTRLCLSPASWTWLRDPRLLARAGAPGSLELVVVRSWMALKPHASMAPGSQSGWCSLPVEPGLCPCAPLVSTCPCACLHGHDHPHTGRSPRCLSDARFPHRVLAGMETVVGQDLPRGALLTVGWLLLTRFPRAASTGEPHTVTRKTRPDCSG